MTPQPPPTLSQRRLPYLFALRDVGTAAADVDVAAAEASDEPTRRVVELTTRCLTILTELEQLDAPEPAPVDLLADGADWSGLGLGLDGDGAPPDRHVADTCFAMRLELRGVLPTVEAARTAEERLERTETLHRKLRRGVRAVLEASREAGDPDILGGDQQGLHRVSDLRQALTVRRLFAEFRRGLRHATGPSAEEVMTAVRYGAGAIATLVTSMDYCELRAADRIVLRELRERVMAWARSDRSVRVGQMLLSDLWTTGDLLRGINRRQEVREHDVALIARLVKGPAAGLDAWFEELAALAGLDDELDALMAAGPPSEATAVAACRRLALLG